MLAAARDVAGDRHIVWRVGEDDPDLLSAEQPLEAGGIGGVAAEQPTVAQPPEVADPADRLIGQGGVLTVIAAVAAENDAVDLGRGEAGQLQAETQIHARELLELQLQGLAIPTSQLAELVLSDGEHSPLGLAQVGNADAGNLGHAEEAAFLAPDLKAAILDGCQPAGLSLEALIRSEMPLDWDDQRVLYAAA
ncbi:hypothetical protein [Brevundimonas sp.]|uniref:hypothetical protein n=1 Tax=Brevundimonas sp. TaxID=1871086 RepID=UPI00286C9020|nr:hypothetical protein [Brevundimonas sp.]